MPMGMPCICGTGATLAGQQKEPSDTGDGALTGAGDGTKLLAFGLSLNSWKHNEKHVKN